MKFENRYAMSLLSAACAICVAAIPAYGQSATVSGRVTNASGQTQEMVRKADDAAACLSDGKTDASDETRLISTTRSNIKRPTVAAEATEAPVGPPGAPISTTRSNIKRPGVAAEATEAPAGPPGAPINTTRSNIKRPGVAAEATEAPAGPPGAPVNTTRSNKKAGMAAVCEEGRALMDVSTTR